MEFFIIMNDVQQGPFTLEQLSGMSIMPDTPVWREGMTDWTAASHVAELQHLVAYAPQPEGTQNAIGEQPTGAQPPQWNPVRETAPSYAPEPEYATQPKPRKSHTALWVTLIIVGLVAILLAVTNPDERDHRRAISGATKDWTKEKVEDLVGGGFFGGITKMITAPLINGVIDNTVNVDNYVLCSVGHIDLGEDKTNVSFGILGHVYTFNKNQIDEKIEEAIGMSFNDAVKTAKEGINGLLDDDDEDTEAIVAPQSEAQDNVQSDEQVTPEDRAESTFEEPSKLDTLLKKGAKMAAKEGAKLAGKAIDKAIDEAFK